MHKTLMQLTLATTVLCFALERAYAAPPVPVAHWSFDGNGLDSSGNHNDATLHGGVSYVAGLYGKAAQFHGSGDYFQVANNPAMQLRSTQQFSVAAYVQPTTLGQQNVLIHGLGCSTWASWFLGVQGGEPDATLYPNSFVFGTRSSGGTAYTGATATGTAGTWTHLAATYDGTTLRLYVNGVLQNSVAAPLPFDSAESLYIGGDPGCSGRSWYTGLVDDVYLFTQALTADEVKVVMQGPVKPQAAREPVPTDGATDVLQDTALSWTAGQYAATHDVYLGKTFTDVNNASRTTPGSVLVGQGQTAATYTPKALLDFGQTYYWRVDEVNKAPDNTIFKGSVWSFTVEPFSYPIAGTLITATASSAMPNSPPENTINGSGLTGDQHSIDGSTMWMSKGTLPNWIQYQFDAVYKLDKLLVWNSNQGIEAYIGFGAKNVTVEYSLDGATWTTLAGVPPFAQAPGLPTYTANTTVNFGGAMAKYVKLTINQSWGGLTTTGLSEVRFYSIPVQARARNRRPAPRA